MSERQWTVDVESLPINAQEGQAPPSWWGMWLFIATEAMLFASLLSSYFYVRFRSATWPAQEHSPELLLPTIATLLLVSSSVVAHRAERAGHRGRRGRLRAGLLGVVALGGAFLAIQLLEYLELGFTPQTHIYGSLFFGITGFHGIHVAVGLVMIVLVATVGWRDGRLPARQLPIRLAVVYWHFVDVVWLFVFGSLYVAEMVL